MNLRHLLWNLQIRIPDQVSRDKSAKITADFLNGYYHWDIKKVGARSAAYASHLQNKGVVKIKNILNDKQILDMHSWLKNKQMYDYYNKSHEFADDPGKVLMGEYFPSVKLSCPHVMDVALDPSVLRAVEAWLGTVPTISYVGLMWSWPRKKPAHEMQRWHRDRVDFKFCKLFVYLTDVLTSKDGPHLYIAGSNKGTRITHGGRFSDQEVLDIYGIEHQSMLLGDAGSSWLADVYQVHRGLPPTTTPRLMLQIEYCMIPPIDRKYFQVISSRKLNMREQHIARQWWK